MIIDENDFIEHFGVKGMKWGVRKDSRPAGVTRKTDKDARKDAEEFARAKMFYGKGAGTRRKLIKNTVDAKSKRSESYKKAFEAHLAKQSMDKHAQKATKERSRTDRRERTKQRAGFFARRATGEMGTQAAFAAVAVGGAAYLNSPRGRAQMDRTVRAVQNYMTRTQNARRINDFLKRTM